MTAARSDQTKPPYRAHTHTLVIWKTRKNQMLGQGWTDVVQSLKGLVAARLRVEHAFYTLTSNLNSFSALWGIKQV